jgi:predicted RNase H-like HicB family nuclease
MKPYIGLVSKESGTSYGIVFPDAPGCFSAADTMDDIFAMASEALAGWTEGMREEGLPFPKCRDLSALRADHSLAELWSDTVMVIAVPAPIRAGDAVAA